MNRVFRLGMYCFAAVLFAACGGDSTSSAGSNAQASFTGKISDAANITMHFEQYNTSRANHIIGSKQLGADGSFAMDLPDKYVPGLYRIRLGSSKVIFPVDGGESKINIEGTLSQLKDFSFDISGSERAQKYVTEVNKAMTGNIPVSSIASNLESLDPISAMAAAITIGGKKKVFLPVHEAVYARMKQSEMKSPYTADYSTYVNNIKNPPVASPQRPVQQQQRRPASKFNVGDVAPDIALESPDGKKYSLNDLKGQVVLLDFWASWCRPCRKENPSVVKIYDKYKDKGFTVFSVSLDGSTDRWKKAIEQDQLAWPYHVSDLKKWKSTPAREYGVSSIPKTFMIDKEGKIAAIGLRGASSIENELKKLL